MTVHLQRSILDHGRAPSIIEMLSTLIEGRNNTTSTLTFRPTASDDIKELACRAENPHFPGGLQEDRRRLRIACGKLGKILSVENAFDTMIHVLHAANPSLCSINEAVMLCNTHDKRVDEGCHPLCRKDSTLRTRNIGKCDATRNSIEYRIQVPATCTYRILEECHNNASAKA
uniref:Uncharacterized protein n=1 Tax=Timema genevievae TaxID=629358 RepID=A0A7R9PJD4_TIMGE|nr:unnamed protein product [Timema genevievae]